MIGKTKHVAFNVSPLQASCDCERLRYSPSRRVKYNSGLPVNKLPTELLCDIFSKFLEDDREFPDYAPAMGPLVSLHTRADPTILGQVCSWWRNVALSTPALWTNIFILEPKGTQIFRTRLWLERAGNHPLNIAIEDRRSVGYNLAPLDQILTALTSRQQLWRRVNFFIPSDALKSLLVAITNQPPDFRNLESASLCIGSQQPCQNVSIDTIWKVFHSSPVLYEVDWHCTYYNELLTHAPWAQLTHLNLQSEFGTESLTDMLVSCTKIRALFLFRLSLTTETTKVLEPIVLENLHTLNLEVEVEPCPLFGRLTLPSLRSLDIRYRYFDSNSPRNIVAFQEFLIRSNCSLERLTFYDEDLDEDHLKAFISSPSLQHVTVLDLQVPISDEIIKSFTRQNNDGYHENMPFLEEMTLSICTSSDGLLAQMVSSRWTNLTAHKDGKTLKRVMLNKDGNYGIEDEIGLSKLFSSGLQGSKS